MNKIEYIESSGWKQALRFARATVGKPDTGKEPSSAWKTKMLILEHSPICRVIIDVKVNDVKTWASQHLARHNKFMVHGVATQRTDRTGISRDDKRQDAPVSHSFFGNAQSFIETSRKRLCAGECSLETVDLWQNVLSELNKIEPELVAVCVPECVYRGFCNKGNKCCGLCNTTEFNEELKRYRALSK